MPIQICVTCGTSFPASAAPPRRCPICDEERQYVPASGQTWTTPDALASAHANAWRQAEPNLFEIETQPRFGIGQRAFLLRTPHGNVLWDCLALLDPATVALVRALGGLSAIAISHPHYYTTMPDWAAAFDAPVYLHARDREWVMRPDDRVVYWEEDERTILPGLDLLRLGGHFPGGSVLHWHDGAQGRGALLSGDIVQVGSDRLAVVVAPDHPWAARRRLAANELASSPWVLRESGSGTRSTLEEAVRLAGADPAALPIAMTLPSNEAVLAAAEAGAGATALSESVAYASVAAGRLATAPFLLPERPFRLLRHKERYRSRAGDAFAELMR